MKAIMVCVDYSDLLTITLPYNRHHFEEVWVVTDFKDNDTMNVIQGTDTHYFRTNAFYEDGAVFNKWKALEQGLDAMGREGWLCIMDADVLWPGEVKVTAGGENSLDFSGPLITNGCSVRFHPGRLITPLRRMMVDTSQLHNPSTNRLIYESQWKEFPLHPQQHEWAGYTQIFHASDPVLGPPPWHEINWKHAGGADSFFQRKWAAKDKVRPPFEVLHLGPAGINWCGRTTAMIDDGTVPTQAAARRATLKAFLQRRRATGNYDHEKIT